MAENPQCATCTARGCREGRDCFGKGRSHRAIYEDPDLERMHRAASAIEARHYCQATRLREVVLFAREMGYSRIGLAFCIGLAEEAKAVAEVLAAEGLTVVSACCKNGGIAKSELGLEQIDPNRPHETMCNPAGQAELLNQAGTQFNVIVGLCVGHDAIFTMRSKAPVSTLIAKDRVLAHNPAAAVYCPYIRKRV